MFCDTSTILPRFLPFAETTETGGGGTRETDTIYKHKNNVREGLQFVLHLLTVEDEEAMVGAGDGRKRSSFAALNSVSVRWLLIATNSWRRTISDRFPGSIATSKKKKK